MLKNILVAFFVMALLSSCNSSDSIERCLVTEALAGYPTDFSDPNAPIEYYYRFEFTYEDGQLIRIEEFNIEDDRLLDTIEDFSNDQLKAGNLSEGTTYTYEDDETKSFITVENGNAILEGIESKNDPNDILIHGRNYFDNKPNALRLPEFRSLYVGKQNFAGLNSKNNLVGWAILQGGPFLEYKFEYNSQGLLKRTQIPSGYTTDYTYKCP